MELIAKIGTNRCAHLRWKGLFIDTAHNPEFDVSADYSTWCRHTCKCVGPDGRMVDPEECRAERACYEKL
jgi:hypothetical protein